MNLFINLNIKKVLLSLWLFGHMGTTVFAMNFNPLVGNMGKNENNFTLLFPNGSRINGIAHETLIVSPLLKERIIRKYPYKIIFLDEVAAHNMPELLIYMTIIAKWLSDPRPTQHISDILYAKFINDKLTKADFIRIHNNALAIGCFGIVECIRTFLSTPLSRTNAPKNFKCAYTDGKAFCRSEFETQELLDRHMDIDHQINQICAASLALPALISSRQGKHVKPRPIKAVNATVLERVTPPCYPVNHKQGSQAPNRHDLQNSMLDFLFEAVELATNDLSSEPANEGMPLQIEKHSDVPDAFLDAANLALEQPDDAPAIVPVDAPHTTQKSLELSFTLTTDAPLPQNLKPRETATAEVPENRNAELSSSQLINYFNANNDFNLDSDVLTTATEPEIEITLEGSFIEPMPEAATEEDPEGPIALSDDAPPIIIEQPILPKQRAFLISNSDIKDMLKRRSATAINKSGSNNNKHGNNCAISCFNWLYYHYERPERLELRDSKNEPHLKKLYGIFSDESIKIKTVKLDMRNNLGAVDLTFDEVVFHEEDNHVTLLDYLENTSLRTISNIKSPFQVGLLYLLDESKDLGYLTNFYRYNNQYFYIDPQHGSVSTMEHFISRNWRDYKDKLYVWYKKNDG